MDQWTIFPGDWNNSMIFHHSLINELEVGERTEADDIYVGQALRHDVCTVSFMDNKERHTSST